jgi:hypothetical protein
MDDSPDAVRKLLVERDISAFRMKTAQNIRTDARGDLVTSFVVPLRPLRLRSTALFWGDHIDALDGNLIEPQI